MEEGKEQHISIWSGQSPDYPQIDHNHVTMSDKTHDVLVSPISMISQILIWPSPAFAGYHASHHLHSLVARSSRVPSGHAHAVLVLQNLLRLKTILWIESAVTMPFFGMFFYFSCKWTWCQMILPNVDLNKIIWSKTAKKGAYIASIIV